MKQNKSFVRSRTHQFFSPSDDEQEESFAEPHTPRDLSPGVEYNDDDEQEESFAKPHMPRDLSPGVESNDDDEQEESFAEPHMPRDLSSMEHNGREEFDEEEAVSEEASSSSMSGSEQPENSELANFCQYPPPCGFADFQARLRKLASSKPLLEALLRAKVTLDVAVTFVSPFIPPGGVNKFTTWYMYEQPTFIIIIIIIIIMFYYAYSYIYVCTGNKPNMFIGP